MKRLCANGVVAIVMVLGGWAWLAPAHAAPPTVTPTQGYDSRLQERRTAPVIYPKPVSRRRVKRTHDATH